MGEDETSTGDVSDDEDPGMVPLIEQFTASEATLPAGGGAIVLSWTVSGADEIAISPDIGTVEGTSVEVEVRETTTFSLTARNSAGMSEETLAVTIENQGILDEEWRAQLGTAEDDRATSVAVDSFGNVIIAGRTRGAIDSTNRGEQDIIIAKYTPRGSLAWYRQWGTGHGELVGQLVVGPSDQIYLLTDIDSYSLSDDPPNQRVQVWSTSGSLHEEWLLAEDFNASDLVVSGDGTVFVSGRPLNATDGEILRLDDSGTATTLASLPDTSPTSIAVGSDGTFYAVSYGPVIFRVAADGEVAWSRNLGSGLDAVTGVALAEDQEVLYISGHTSTDVFGDSLDGIDAYVAKLSTENGELLESWQFGTSRDDFAADVTVDAMGNAYVTGGDSCTRSRGYFTNCSAFVVKVSHPDDQLAWSIPSFLEMTDAMRDYEMGVAAGPSGYVYVAGPVSEDFAAINAGGTDAFVVRVR